MADKNTSGLCNDAFFFSCPTTIKEAADSISDFFGVDNQELIIDFITKLIDTKEPTYSTMNGFSSGFPVNLILEESQEFADRRMYVPKDFSFKELDFKGNRMYSAPLSVVFMPNNNCFTDCVYCYADKSKHNGDLSFDKIACFIQEAKKLKVRDILITGGDFFMFKSGKNY